MEDEDEPAPFFLDDDQMRMRLSLVQKFNGKGHICKAMKGRFVAPPAGLCQKVKQ